MKTPPFVGLEMKQAARNRKYLPGGGELAQMLRNGETVLELVDRFDSSRTSIYTKLRDSGYGPDGVPLTKAVVRRDPDFMFTPTEWTELAECASDLYDPDWWHAEGAGAKYATMQAQKVCKSCPVQLKCLTYGLEVDEQTNGRHGVYGGLTGEQRAELAG